jgi:hypothetical protein
MILDAGFYRSDGIMTFYGFIMNKLFIPICFHVDTIYGHAKGRHRGLPLQIAKWN